MIVINKMVCSVQWCCNHCVKNTSITVNKYRFCISVIGHINKQIIGIGIGSKKSISVDHYKEQKLLFVNNWNLFWERPRLFRADGLHPSRVGAELLSDNISRTLCSV